MTRRRARPFGYYVVKAVRWTGWLLLALMVLYILSGYALSGTFGLDGLMSEATATAVHVNWKLDRLLLVLLIVHAGGATYLAMRRWGWIRTRKTT